MVVAGLTVRFAYRPDHEYWDAIYGDRRPFGEIALAVRLTLAFWVRQVLYPHRPAEG